MNDFLMKTAIANRSKTRFFGLLIFCVCILVPKISLEGVEPRCTVEIPMRDGFTLPTDLYIPLEGNPSDYPCVLLRSPAGRKNSFAAKYAYLASKGYVVAIQDTRSATDTEGKTFPGLSDGWGKEQDGYDAIEWLAKSPFCNGKIGTAGVSALGITQYLLAPSAPPSLKCQYIGVAASSMYHHALCPGGQLLKDQVEGWLGLYAKDCGVHCFAATRPFYNDFWRSLNSLEVADRVNVPAIHYGGWYDTFIQGTLDAFVARQEHGAPGARNQQKLLIGPWTHFWPQMSCLGDFQIPKGSFQAPIDLSCERWFDYHLKGEPNGINQAPAVIYYVMGPFDGSPSKGNKWRSADHWPPKSEPTSLYLNGSEELLTEAPKRHAQSSYTYDPSDPVPTVGGRNLFLESGPKDQRVLEEREDVLVYTTPILKHDLEVTGKIHAKLYFTSNCADTDVVVRLTDVYPDGKSILIADGMYRTGVKNVETLHDPHAPAEIDIDLWSTSMVFAQGHRIRISISSSNYPRFERNLNVGLVGSYHGSQAIAENKIHTGPKTPSRIILPVVHAK